MKAKYIKREMPDLRNTGQTQVCYRLQTLLMEGEDFVRKAVRNTTLGESEFVMALGLLADELACHLAQGYAVSVPGLGIFTARIGLVKDVETEQLDGDEPKRNARSLEVKGVNFRADRGLVRNIRGCCQLERGGTVRIRQPRLSLEQRIAKAQAFLDRYQVMRVGDYARLTGLSRTAASLELRRLDDSPSSGIASSGSGSGKVYIRKKTVG